MRSDGRDVRMCCNLSVLSSLMNVTMSATITIIILTPPPVILPLITGHRSDVTVLSSHNLDNGQWPAYVMILAVIVSPLQHVTVMLSLSGSDQARVAADVTALQESSMVVFSNQAKCHCEQNTGHFALDQLTTYDT